MGPRIREVLRDKGSLVHAVECSTSICDAVLLMNARRVGALLIEEDGRLGGILSERDVLRRVIPQGLDVHQTPVRDVMTTEVLTIRPDHGIKEAMRLMTEKRVRHLPVIEGERVVGLVSIGDLTKWVSRDLEQEVYDLSSYIAGAYVVRPFLA